MEGTAQDTYLFDATVTASVRLLTVIILSVRSDTLLQSVLVVLGTLYRELDDACKDLLTF